MIVRYLDRVRLAALCLMLSAAFQFFCFRHWPGEPMFDLGYSIFAAQNLIAHGKFVSINMLTDYSDDLARAAQMAPLVHFPPGQSLVYAALMSLGLSPGVATKMLVLLGILTGGAGWIALARYLKTPPGWAIVIALVYPWLPFIVQAHSLYMTEHVAGALMPWFCLALLSVSRAHTVSRLAVAVALAFALVAFKYSMAWVFPGAGIFFVLIDGRGFLKRSLWWKGTVAALMIAPALLGLLVSHAYGPRILVNANPVPLAAWAFVRNIFENSISVPSGWSALVSRYFMGAAWQTNRLLIDISAVAVAAAFLHHLRVHPPRGRLRRFALLLVSLTVTLWLGLAAASIAGQGQWNFSADERLYMPIVSMWLLFAVVALARLRPKHLLRAPAFYLCAIPISLMALLTFRGALVHQPQAAMPHSQLAWIESPNRDHATFLAAFAGSRVRKPDLMIGSSALMNEIEVPSIANGYFVAPDHRYWSSKPLEVWALVLPSEQGKLLKVFSDAQAEKVATPAGYPFLFYIFRLGPAKAPASIDKPSA